MLSTDTENSATAHNGIAMRRKSVRKTAKIVGLRELHIGICNQSVAIAFVGGIAQPDVVTGIVASVLLGLNERAALVGA